MMTDKQFNYMKALLIEKSDAHPKYGLNSKSRAITGMPLSARSWEAMRQRLTKKQASEIISKLLDA